MLVAVAFLALLTSAPATCTEPGKLLWGLKSNVPAHSSITKAKLVKLSHLMDLPYPDSMPNRALEIRDRLPLIANPDGVKEGDMIRTRGWLRLIATEDNEVFPAASAALTASDRQAIGNEMAFRRFAKCDQ